MLALQEAPEVGEVLFAGCEPGKAPNPLDSYPYMCTCRIALVVWWALSLGRPIPYSCRPWLGPWPLYTACDGQMQHDHYGEVLELLGAPFG